MKELDKFKQNTSILTIANNPNTSAPVLVDLAANTQDKEVLKAIAQNPNSPPELLLELAQYFLSNIGENPCLDLIIIEDPSFIESIYIKYFSGYPLCFLQQSNVPVWYLKAAFCSSNSCLRTFVASHPQTPSETLKLLAKDLDCEIRYSIAINPKTPSSTLAYLAFDRDEKVRNHARYWLENRCNFLINFVLPSILTTFTIIIFSLFFLFKNATKHQDK